MYIFVMYSVMLGIFDVTYIMLGILLCYVYCYDSIKM